MIKPKRAPNNSDFTDAAATTAATENVTSQMENLRVAEVRNEQRRIRTTSDSTQISTDSSSNQSSTAVVV